MGTQSFVPGAGGLAPNGKSTAANIAVNRDCDEYGP